MSENKYIEEIGDILFVVLTNNRSVVAVVPISGLEFFHRK
jgi:hypothetical protein